MNKFLISFVNKRNLFNIKKHLHTVSFNLKNSESNLIKDESNKSNKETNLDESDKFGIGSRFAETGRTPKIRSNDEYRSNFNKNKSFSSSSYVKHKNMDDKINANEKEAIDDGDKFGTLTNQLDDV
jgi:hypothetical protein